MEKITKEISSEEMEILIKDNKDNPNFVILDVRTGEEFKEGHIKNAINHDIYSSDFTEKIKALDKEKIYLVYCERGTRSLAATIQIMEHFGFKNLHHLKNGLVEWKEKKYPLVK